MTSAGPRFRHAALAVALAAAGCASERSGVGGESHFACVRDADCEEHPGDLTCIAGWCRPSSEASDGSFAGAGAGGAGAGGEGPTAGGAPSSGGGAADAGAGGAASGGGGGAPPREGGTGLATACFVAPPTVCAWGQVAASVGSSEWTVREVMPAADADRLVLEVTRPPPEGGAGREVHAVAMDRAGGCVDAVSGAISETSPQWGVTRAAAGGGTAAAIVRCSYKFACGSELHAGGARVLDLEASLGEPDLFRYYRHEVAVGSDGLLFAASGPGGNVAGPAELEKLVLFRAPVGGGASPTIVSDFTEVLGGIAPGPDGTAILLTHERADGGRGPSLLRRMDALGATYWQVPLDIHVDHLAASGELVVAAGELAPSAGVVVRGFEMATGTPLWQTLPVRPGALPLGVGVGATGPVRLLTTGTIGLGVLVSVDRVTGAVGAEAGIDTPTLPAPAVDDPVRFAVTPDGTAIAAIRDRMIACAP